jgi:perosamine synthetase
LSVLLALLGGKKIRNKPFSTQAIIGSEEKKRILKVLEGGVLSGFIAKAGPQFLGGVQVKELERKVKEYFKSAYAVSVNSATAGLHAALGACGIGPGDEVIVPAYTMSASATAILMVNAIPVFADIDAHTFCIDPLAVKKAITARTKAIVVVHLFGYPADMDGIMKLARKHKLAVIEDCAQAPGAKYKGAFVGTLGDIGVFSLNQHKTITSGEGGFCLTEDERLALRMQLIRNHGEVIAEYMGLQDLDNIIGYNYRMTELEAAVSIGQFKRLDFLNKYRIELAHYLTARLSKYPGLILPQEQGKSTHVYFTYPIRFQEKVAGVSRNVFAKALNAEGIPVGIGYVKPIYLEAAYQKRIGYGKKGCPFTCAWYKGKAAYYKGLCPVTEKMYEKELMLIPVCRYPHKKTDIDDVARAFDKVYRNLEVLKKAKL